MRLIDAEALKRAIKTECNPYGKPTIDFESGKKVLEIIDDAPTVDTTFREVVAYECGQKSVEERPKGKWVPVTERLPEAHNYYLVTAYPVIDNQYWTEMGYFDGIEWWIGDFKTSKVIAWMPLPEPYKRGDV